MQKTYDPSVAEPTLPPPADLAESTPPPPAAEAVSDAKPSSGSTKKKKRYTAFGRLQAAVRGFKKQKTAEILPDELALPILEAAVQAHTAAEHVDTAALVQRKGSVSRAEVAEEKLGRAIGRWERILNGAVPEGSPERGDFFLGGPGPHDEVARGARLLEGRKLHPKLVPDRVLPPVLRPDAMRALIAEVEAAREERTDAKSQKQVSSPARKDVTLRTRTLARRVTEFLLGYLETDAELAAYGVKRPGGKRKKK